MFYDHNISSSKFHTQFPEILILLNKLAVHASFSASAAEPNEVDHVFMTLRVAHQAGNRKQGQSESDYM